MNKKIFGICDPDRDYAESFSRFVYKKEGNRFDVRAFTKPELLREYLNGGSFDVLLVSEDFIDAGEDMQAGEGVFPEKSTFVLSDEREACDYIYPVIYKYQSTEKILSHILQGFDKKDGSRRGRGKCRVTGIYSPVKRSGRTGFSLALAKTLAEKKSVLYLSFEELCSEDFLRKENNPEALGISDILYKYTVDGDEEVFSTAEIPSHSGFDYLAAASCPDDIRNADCSLLRFIVEEFKKQGNYREIVIDISDYLPEPEKLLDACDEIAVPVLGDERSEKRLELWEDYLIGRGAADLIEKSRRITVPIYDIEDFAQSYLKQRER